MLAVGSVPPFSRPNFSSQYSGYMGGSTPTHWLDFMNNRAVMAGVDVGAIASIAGITGTLNLSDAGHTVASAANGLIIPLTAVAYPLSFFIEFVRTVDTGAIERVARVDDGTTNNKSEWFINAVDSLRWSIDAAAVNQANMATGLITTGSVFQGAGRVNTNSAQSCKSPNGAIGGAEDTVVTLPANPTRLVIGVDSAGAWTFSGVIRRIALFNGSALDDTLLGATISR